MASGPGWRESSGVTGSVDGWRFFLGETETKLNEQARQAGKKSLMQKLVSRG